MVEQTNSQQRLIAALGYLFTPVVPLVVLSTDLKHDRFLKRHAGQSMLWSAGFIVGLALAVVAAIWMLRVDLLFLCLLPVVFLLPFLPGMVWGWRAYNGGDPRPPLIAPLAARLLPVD